MDLNTIRIAFTLLMLTSFIVIVSIVCQRRAKQRYQNIAQHIIDDDDAPVVPRSCPEKRP